jgi:hypothetical protein
LKSKLIGYNPIEAKDYPACRDIAIMLYQLTPTPLDGLAFPSYQSDAHNLNLETTVSGSLLSDALRKKVYCLFLNHHSLSQD